MTSPSPLKFQNSNPQQNFYQTQLSNKESKQLHSQHFQTQHFKPFQLQNNHPIQYPQHHNNTVFSSQSKPIMTFQQNNIYQNFNTLNSQKSTSQQQSFIQQQKQYDVYNNSRDKNNFNRNYTNNENVSTTNNELVFNSQEPHSGSYKESNINHDKPFTYRQGDSQTRRSERNNSNCLNHNKNKINNNFEVNNYVSNNHNINDSLDKNEKKICSNFEFNGEISQNCSNRGIDHSNVNVHNSAQIIMTTHSSYILHSDSNPNHMNNNPNCLENRNQSGKMKNSSELTVKKSEGNCLNNTHEGFLNQSLNDYDSNCITESLYKHENNELSNNYNILNHSSSSYAVNTVNNIYVNSNTNEMMNRNSMSHNNAISSFSDSGFYNYENGNYNNIHSNNNNNGNSHIFNKNNLKDQSYNLNYNNNNNFNHENNSTNIINELEDPDKSLIIREDHTLDSNFAQNEISNGNFKNYTDNKKNNNNTNNFNASTNCNNSSFETSSTKCEKSPVAFTIIFDSNNDLKNNTDKIKSNGNHSNDYSDKYKDITARLIQKRISRAKSQGRNEIISKFNGLSKRPNSGLDLPVTRSSSTKRALPSINTVPFNHQSKDTTKNNIKQTPTKKCQNNDCKEKPTLKTVNTLNKFIHIHNMVCGNNKLDKDESVHDMLNKGRVTRRGRETRRNRGCNIGNRNSVNQEVSKHLENETSCNLTIKNGLIKANSVDCYTDNCENSKKIEENLFFYKPNKETNMFAYKTDLDKGDDAPSETGTYVVKEDKDCKSEEEDVQNDRDEIEYSFGLKSKDEYNQQSISIPINLRSEELKRNKLYTKKRYEKSKSPSNRYLPSAPTFNRSGLVKAKIRMFSTDVKEIYSEDKNSNKLSVMTNHNRSLPCCPTHTNKTAQTNPRNRSLKRDSTPHQERKTSTNNYNTLASNSSTSNPFQKVLSRSNTPSKSSNQTYFSSNQPFNFENSLRNFSSDSSPNSISSEKPSSFKAPKVQQSKNLKNDDKDVNSINKNNNINEHRVVTRSKSADRQKFGNKISLTQSPKLNKKIICTQQQNLLQKSFSTQPHNKQTHTQTPSPFIETLTQTSKQLFNMTNASANSSGQPSRCRSSIKEPFKKHFNQSKRISKTPTREVGLRSMQGTSVKNDYLKNKNNSFETNKFLVEENENDLNTYDLLSTSIDVVSSNNHVLSRTSKISYKEEPTNKLSSKIFEETTIADEILTIASNYSTATYSRQTSAIKSNENFINKHTRINDKKMFMVNEFLKELEQKTEEFVKTLKLGELSSQSTHTMDESNLVHNILMLQKLKNSDPSLSTTIYEPIEKSSSF